MNSRGTDLSRNGSGENRKSSLHVCEIDRRVGIVLVAGHARDDGACDFLDLVIALRESHKNSDVFCGRHTSSFDLTVDVCGPFCDEAGFFVR